MIDDLTKYKILYQETLIELVNIETENDKLKQDKARLVEALKEAKEEIYRMSDCTASCYYDKEVIDKTSALIEEMEGGQDG